MKVKQQHRFPMTMEVTIENPQELKLFNRMVSNNQPKIEKVTETILKPKQMKDIVKETVTVARKHLFKYGPIPKETDACLAEVEKLKMKLRSEDSKTNPGLRLSLNNRINTLKRKVQSLMEPVS